MNALLAQAKTSTVDHTKVSEGFTREVPPAGPSMARFIGYVEVGKQPQEFEGKAKNPALEAYIMFELNSKKHIREVEIDGVNKTFANRITAGGGGVAVYTNSKAGFHKLFSAMRAGRENITHIAHMLGEPFKIDVVHSVPKKEGDPVYANMKDDNGWKIGPPMVTKFNDEGEPLETIVLKVPEAIAPLQLLLWDAPTKEQWDSIFIDGTYKKKVNVVEVEVSKNWLQELCMKAVDYKGSALEAMLTGGDALAGELEQGLMDEIVEQSVGKSAAAAQDTQAGSTANAGTAAANESAKNTAAGTKATVADTKSADDVLAGLGL